jgi:rhomboid protease GluP
VNDNPTPPRQLPPGYDPPATQGSHPTALRVEHQVIKPTVTYTLLAITGGIFLLQILSSQLLGFDVPESLGLKENTLIAQGQFWRLITPMFLHGSILHVSFNMYALYIFGQGLERYYGHIRFLALYFISGFAGNVLSMILTDAPSLGASTAIFGLLAAQGVFLYQNRGMLGTGARRALNNLITIAVLNLVIGLSPEIDNWGHVGGLIGGFLFSWFAGPVMSVTGQIPYASLTDTRQDRLVIFTTIWVALIFIGLALITIGIRTGLI